MERLQQTPSQTVGPFFAYSLTAEQYSYEYNSIVNELLLDDNTEGERIYITGSIYDGKGNAISDAMIELWQADADGNYRALPINKKNDGFTGFGRLGTGTNEKHHFTFKTIKPGSVNGQSPHINVILFMRGSLHALYTRMYFSDEANYCDPLLSSVEASRRQTLIAERKEINGSITYHFDMHMQGEKETVFFEV
ncbi:protocatechuate 3,4-dioxygenase subunit alpha [Panacibacter ginsenosidivorans]|uniref:Protocatechuate 3,4-dioxygenase subunit alpha n=1 Tax=Panacibacter ginsenosidivorans TaxID=1813871 RepID=A0A5B8V935_9BACT|nr:protocatechuate 3,4-dioxygenase subunit alpha [Panacibacter ginsenosidivorans]QEC66858.1 protocatechuate 3,4-dioxygenase subunit alpha [Panacibacter ginsenosidivorans]